MIAAYLALNSVLYLGFAAVCLLRPTDTAASIGYLSLSDSGRCEFLTIYGGLQAGLGIFFALAAYRPGWWLPGLCLTASLYVPLVLVRWIGIAQAGQVASTTWAIAGLESVLMLAAVTLVILSFQPGNGLRLD